MKVVCVKSRHQVYFTPGKVYEVVDGCLVDNTNYGWGKHKFRGIYDIKTYPAFQGFYEFEEITD